MKNIEKKLNDIESILLDIKTNIWCISTIIFIIIGMYFGWFFASKVF